MIDGNKIKVETTNEEWHFSKLGEFLKNKKFLYLNITYLGNDRNRIYYILAEEEILELNHEEVIKRVSI